MELLTSKLYTKEGRHIDFDGSMKVFNLGSGSQRYNNVIGIDAVKSAGADIVHDLNEIPWPIPERTADVVLAFHILEHVEDLPRVMEEIHRIAKPGARLIAEVPYFRSVLAFQDPTHRRFFTTRSFDYFSKEKGLGRYGYAKADFKILDFWLGWPAPSKNPLKQMAKNFFRKYQDLYDRRLSRLCLVDIIVFELVVKK